MVPRTLFLLWALLLPLHAAALGLGDIRVDSALNEPLDARIELLSLDPREVQDIRVVLADQHAFKKAGLERPYLLNSLRFKVGIDGRGNGFVHVTTRASIKEPFLNFLLEVSWRGGVLQREYVVLLDPPRYRLARTSAQPGEAAAPTKTVTLAPRKQSKLYSVRPAETLWEIAEEVRPNRSHTTEQVMMALQRRNPEAFLDNNVNQLKSGALLEVPDSVEVERMGSVAAKREFQRQTQVWKEKRARLQQSVAPVVPEQGVGEEVPEQQVPAEPEPSAATQEPVEEQARLKILEPVDREAVELALSSTEGEPGEQMQRLRTAIDASKQELESVREINRELDQLRATLETEIGALRQALHERDAVIDELIKRMEREDAAAAALEQRETGAGTLIIPPAEEEPAIEEEPGAIESSLAGSGSLIQEETEDVGSSSWVTGLFLVVILVMSLVAFFLWWSMNRGRRGKEEAVLYNRLELPEVAIKKESYDGLYRKLEQQEREERTRQNAGQDKQLPEEEVDVLLTDEFLDEVEAESSDAEEAPEITTEAKVDVGAILTEADVYLIYRQYAKAESLVQECLQSHPQEVELMAKLLEIYASQKAKAQFVTYLDEVADSIREADPDVWRRIVDLGSSLVPEHPLFNLGGSVISEDNEFNAGLSQQDTEEASADIPSFEERLRDSSRAGELDSMDLELDFDDSDKDSGR